ncbi:MAG: YIP1 family protein [Acetobacteraceae bacterium]|nr:YIP1 family protein [Acetobacteraceae bacterium]
MTEEGSVGPVAPLPAEGGPPPAGKGGGAVGRGLEAIFGVLFSPGATLTALAARPPLGLAALVVGVTSVLGAMVSVLGVDLPVPLGPGPIAVWVLAVVAAAYFSWLAAAAGTHLVAELLGGRGRATGLAALLGVAQSPGFILQPVLLVLALARVGWQWAALLALAGWVLALDVMAVRRSHQLSVGRAVGAVFLPGCAAAVVLFLLLAAMIALAFPLVQTIPWPEPW